MVENNKTIFKYLLFNNIFWLTYLFFDFKITFANYGDNYEGFSRVVTLSLS